MIEWQEASGEGLIRLRVGQYAERGVGEWRVGQTQEANAAQVRPVRQMRQVTARETALLVARRCYGRRYAQCGGQCDEDDACHPVRHLATATSDPLPHLPRLARFPSSLNSYAGPAP